MPEKENTVLTLHVVLAVAGLGVLKMDGPWYADGIAAGLFFVGFVMAASTARTTQSHRLTFAAFSLFFLASAVAVVWLTFVSPQTAVTEDEASEPTSVRTAYSKSGPGSSASPTTRSR